MPPWTTYRVQLRAGVDFAAVAGLTGYLARLGVTHLHCSPVLAATPGSEHGYDVVDPTRLDPALGGDTGYAELVRAVRHAGLGHVLDIVPNHMAAGPSNPWWWDVLENGPASRYAAFFDIDWEGGEPASVDTVLVPILADHYGRVLEAGELRVERRGGVVDLRYGDSVLPVSPRTLADLLAGVARAAGSPGLAAVAEELAALPPARATSTEAEARHARRRALTAALDELCHDDPLLARAVDDAIAALNADTDRLDELLRRQHYRLAHWRTAGEELDYRRFFNIESLVALRCEDPVVFDETHRLVLRLVAEGTVQGLRIDHVDGLRDPLAYLRRLAERTNGVFTAVEKILETEETLPGCWPVAGTTGYDFAARVGNLFVDSENEAAMSACYRTHTGRTADFAAVAEEAKRQIMRDELAAEVERVTGLLAEVTDRHRRHRDHTRRALRQAVVEFVSHFPVYRTYVRPGHPPSAADAERVRQTVRRSLERRADLDGELLSFLGELALAVHPGGREAEFALRLQQLTAPVMAKGVEDTAFYRYHRLISLNEVGGDPGVFGRPVEDFHRRTAATAEQWPDAMLTLSTHDTKRSADVRARLHVLSELPAAWETAVVRWTEANDRHRCGPWPDANAEYLLYQTLVGAWPIDVERVVAFMAKATKEAKVHTSWTDPVPDYDDAVAGFVRAVLGDERFTQALADFLARHRVVARGRRTSLAQTALLLTCPGVADVYQGDELWDLSLVDPDNRRPVDWALRRALLEELGAAGSSGHPGTPDGDEVGRTKLRLLHRLLVHRRSCPAAYGPGGYEALALGGRRAAHAVAYRRPSLAVVVPRLGQGDWDDTAVDLPGRSWTDVVTNRPVEGGRQLLGELFARFPVAVLARTSG